jgi:hypothetical protein
MLTWLIDILKWLIVEMQEICIFFVRGIQIFHNKPACDGVDER